MQTFLFKAKNGEMDLGSPYNQARFKQYLKENQGKVFRIEQEKSTRTLSQNALYWKFLGVIEMETGNGANDLHEYFRRTLLEPKFITVMGKEIKIPRSTTELAKYEFGEYMEKISALSGVPVPDTEEYLKALDLATLK
jgi:hypothetical protein